MRNALTLVLTTILLTASTYASELFNQFGVEADFKWAPQEYNVTGFKYDILYYIPKKQRKYEKVLIFMHGGGQSTMTRSGSYRVAKSYLTDLKKLANKLNFVLVAPSGSGLNWGGHTRGMIRDLAKLIRQELNVNSNKMGLAGHSMGGMGITRNSLWFADQFAFIMPMAAGMDQRHTDKDKFLYTNFNTPYHHLQGLNDHFQVFVERCKYQEKRMSEIERREGKKSKFVMEYYNGSHNYDRLLVEKRLNEYFGMDRNLYQKELHGIVYGRWLIHEYNNIKYPLYNTSDYFWLSVDFKKATENANIVEFTATMKNNRVEINADGDMGSLKSIKVYLSKKMIDFSKPVNVYVNDRFVATKKPMASAVNTVRYIKEKQDKNFIFDDMIRIDL